MTFRIEGARLTHVGPIASNIRTIDRQECEALGRSPKDALRMGLRCATAAHTALVDGRPVAMLGVNSLSAIEGRGTVWMLGTCEVFRHARELLTYGPAFLAMWMETYSRLENIVSVENTAAIRLLKRLGFTVGDDVKRVRGVEFVDFWIES